jgi:hypothetical protein
MKVGTGFRTFQILPCIRSSLRARFPIVFAAPTFIPIIIAGGVSCGQKWRIAVHGAGSRGRRVAARIPATR